MIISTKFTHADLLSAPDDGKRREIMDGELILTPAPKLLHELILNRLNLALLKYLEVHPIGQVVLSPMDVIFSEYDVLQPDLIFVRNKRIEILKDWVRGAPDLVIEILSPTTAARDRGVKLKSYARFGVKEYWIVDPDERAIELYELTREGYELARRITATQTLVSPVLPGFILSVAQLLQS